MRSSRSTPDGGGWSPSAVTALAADSWTAGYRHGEELLARLDALLRDEGLSIASIGGIIVGTGPGAFTGLRVGLATAKGLAHGLGRQLAGVSTGAALLEAARRAGAREPLALLLPAGPNDRVLVTAAPAPSHGHTTALRLAAGEEPDLAAGTTLIAVDLADRAPAEAVVVGEGAGAAVAAALVALGATRLAAGDADDAAALVPVRDAPKGDRADGRSRDRRAGLTWWRDRRSSCASRRCGHPTFPRSRPSSVPASPPRGRPRPTAPSSRRIAWPRTSSPGSTAGSSPTAGSG
jgi:tRNA threonylcarbamoyl adenosine modification protein YeaZ